MTKDELHERHASRYRWMDAVLEDPELTDGAKILAVRLALTTNLKTGLCYPSVKTLAAQTNMDPRGIRGLRAQLVEKGWIRCNSGGRGPKDTNSYVLLRRNDSAALGRDRGDAPPENPPETIPRRNDGAVKAERKEEPNLKKGGTVVPPIIENNQNTEINSGDDADAGGDARARELKAVVDKIANLAGLPSDRSKWPKYWGNAVPVVAQWRESFPDEVILLAVEWAMRVKTEPGVTPNSIKYFEQPIRQRHAVWTGQTVPSAKHPKTTAAPSLGERQRRLNEIAELIGWHVATELTEDQAVDLADRWGRGEVTKEELHRLKDEVEGRLRQKQPLRA